WGARTSSSAEPHRQVAEEGGDDEHDADGAPQRPERVTADAARLDQPKLLRLNQEEVGHPVDGAVDHLWLDPVVQEASQRQPRPNENQVVELVDEVLVLDE